MTHVRIPCPWASTATCIAKSSTHYYISSGSGITKVDDSYKIVAHLAGAKVTKLLWYGSDLYALSAGRVIRYTGELVAVASAPAYNSVLVGTGHGIVYATQNGESLALCDASLATLATKSCRFKPSDAAVLGDYIYVVEQGGRTEDFIVLAGKLDVVEQGQAPSDTVHVHTGGSAIRYTGEPSYWNGTESVLGVGYANGTDKCFADGGFLDIYDSSTVLEGEWPHAPIVVEPPPLGPIVISITDFSPITYLGPAECAELAVTPIVVAVREGVTVSLEGANVSSVLDPGPFGAEFSGRVEDGVYRLGTIVSFPHVVLRDIWDDTALSVFESDGGSLGLLNANPGTAIEVGATTWPLSLVPADPPTVVGTGAVLRFAVTPVAGYSGISVSGSGTGSVTSWGSWEFTVEVENTHTFLPYEPFNAVEIITSITGITITVNPE